MPRTTRELFEHKSRSAACRLAALALIATFLPTSAALADDDFTSDFPIEDCSWSNRGENPFFSLQPGRFQFLEGEEDGTTISQLVTVRNQIVSIAFKSRRGKALRVRTRVVTETEWEDGELVEVSRNFFARCVETGDIYYFGETVDDYEDGEIVGHEGEWRAGRDGAQPGIIMPGSFLLGARYYQEFAPENDALDRGENVEMGVDIDVPAGSFSNCVVVEETTPLEPGDEGEKAFCPWVGIVIDEDLELIEYGTM